jgi:quercetin dioxygenase-like cupin family protein
MRLITEGNKNYVYSGRFTGDVQLEMIIEAEVPTDPDIARVHSFGGAVTKLHSHPGGQVLLLLSGVGRAGDSSRDFRDIAPGTFIETPANETHWHGAEEGQDCVWLATTFGLTAWTDVVPTCCQ